MNNPYIKTLEPVWQNLKYVSVNEEKLQELIEKMGEEQVKIPSWTIENAQPPANCEPELWINYICWLNTINFAFTNFEPPYNKFIVEYPEGTQWRGSFALGASFMRAYNAGYPIFDAEFMRRISRRMAEEIFKPIDSHHQIPMLGQRHSILREVGKILLKKYNGSWLELFEKSGYLAFDKCTIHRGTTRGRGIAERLVADFPSFRDERFYNGYRLKFYKRAQLLAMMYHGRALSSVDRLRLIKDINDIGPIADYTVPKVLAFLGIIEYAPAFKKALSNCEIIQPGDPREVENRLAMSYVMKKICDELKINMAQADYYIWSRGRESQEPHILVPTTDY